MIRMKQLLSEAYFYSSFLHSGAMLPGACYPNTMNISPLNKVLEMCRIVRYAYYGTVEDISKGLILGNLTDSTADQLAEHLDSWINESVDNKRELEQLLDFHAKIRLLAYYYSTGPAVHMEEIVKLHDLGYALPVAYDLPRAFGGLSHEKLAKLGFDSYATTIIHYENFRLVRIVSKYTTDITPFIDQNTFVIKASSDDHKRVLDILK